MRADRHSRMVALLKVLLPLAALSILSTLFLLSRTINPEKAIPFADKEIQDRLRNQQVTGPFFSGTTADGDEVSLSAKKMTTPNGTTGQTTAQDIALHIRRASGLRLNLVSRHAELDIAENRVQLDGNVVITASSGYKAQTSRLVSKLSALDLIAPKTVTATGPIGELTSGSMKFSAADAKSSAQLLFTDGVKLVYNPKDY